MTIYVGVDTGVSGAIGVIFPDGTVEAFDMPTLQIVVGKGKDQKTRRVLDRKAILLFLETHGPDDVCVALEKPSAMPKTTISKDGREITQGMGAVAMLSYGISHGVWLGICTALRIPVDEIHPLTWKSKMCAGMAKGKDVSRLRVMELFPSVDVTRKKDHGKADALLIAEYRRRLG